MLSYGSNSNGDINPIKYVIVTQVDWTNLRCEVKERATNGARFFVDISSAVGHFYHYPSNNEEWIVKKLGGIWVFDRRTSTQNDAITTMQSSNPGDLVLNTPGNIIVTSPLVQANVTNKWTATKIVPNATMTTSGNLALANINNTSIASIDSSTRLKILTSGTYAVSFRVSGGSIGTFRAFTQIDTPNFIRRNSFAGEDSGWIESTMPLNKDDILIFSIYQATGGSVTYTEIIEITKVR